LVARFSFADFPHRDFVWSSAIAFPFDMALSKNRMWRTTRQGRTYVPRDSEAAHDAIVLAIRARHCPVIPKTKLWLSLLVEKPDMRSDALNFLDVVADAASEGLGLNDRWYSVDIIDWVVAKDSPRIFLRVGQ
jgi:Holliday junction resolvase RusA-like endonuclease